MKRETFNSEIANNRKLRNIIDSFNIEMRQNKIDFKINYDWVYLYLISIDDLSLNELRDIDFVEDRIATHLDVQDIMEYNIVRNDNYIRIINKSNKTRSNKHILKKKLFNIEFQKYYKIFINEMHCPLGIQNKSQFKKAEEFLMNLKGKPALKFLKRMKKDDYDYYCKPVTKNGQSAAELNELMIYS